jgi:hypothetical protein
MKPPAAAGGERLRGNLLSFRHAALDPAASVVEPVLIRV